MCEFDAARARLFLQEIHRSTRGHMAGAELAIVCQNGPACKSTGTASPWYVWGSVWPCMPFTKRTMFSSTKMPVQPLQPTARFWK